MIVSETMNLTALPIRQEDHADVSAHFAPHWGDPDSSKLDSYKSTLFAPLHHDSYEREQLKEDCIRPISVVDGKQEEGLLRITPVDKTAGQIAAYRSDVYPLKIGLRVRTLPKRDFPSGEKCRHAYLTAARGLLYFQLTR